MVKFSLLRSSANSLVYMFSAALETLYGDIEPGLVVKAMEPRMELILKILRSVFFFKRGRNLCVTKAVPTTLVLNTSNNCSPVL